MNRHGTLLAVAVVVSSLCLGCSSQEPQKVEGTLNVNGLDDITKAYRQSELIDKPYPIQLGDKSLLCEMDFTFRNDGTFSLGWNYYEFVDGNLVEVKKSPPASE